MKAIKFGKRALSTFVASHGVRLGLGNDSGARLIEEADYTGKSCFISLLNYSKVLCEF